MGIVVVDIDGTIAEASPDRLKFIQQERKDWDKFYEMRFDDKPIMDIISLVKSLQDSGHDIFFCTGRRKSTYTLTRDWMSIHLPDTLMFAPLIMRPDDDGSHDTECKPKALDRYLGFYDLSKDDVFMILEDRNSMVKRWRELGYRCLQVQEGDF